MLKVFLWAVSHSKASLCFNNNSHDNLSSLSWQILIFCLCYSNIGLGLLAKSALFWGVTLRYSWFENYSHHLELEPPRSLKQGEREQIDCVGCFKEPGKDTACITSVYIKLTFTYYRALRLSAKEAEKWRGAHEFWWGLIVSIIVCPLLTFSQHQLTQLTYPWDRQPKDLCSHCIHQNVQDLWISGGPLCQVRIWSYWVDQIVHLDFSTTWL